MAQDPSWSTMTLGDYRRAAEARLATIDPASQIGQCLATLSAWEQIAWMCQQDLISGKAVNRFDQPDEDLLGAWQAEHC